MSHESADLPIMKIRPAILRLRPLLSFPPLGYTALLAWDRRWISPPAAEVTVTLSDGRRLNVSLADRTQRTMYLGLFEPAETKLLRSVLRTGDTFVDVGAHIGWFSTLAAARVGSTGTVIAIEPYPENAARLKNNITLNGFKKVRIVEKALAEHPGSVELRLVGDSGGVTALDWAIGAPTIVEMTTLDSITAELRSIRVLKIDVEGWEEHVLGGASATLQKTENVLIEANKSALRRSGSSEGELRNILGRHGFDRIRVIPQAGLPRLNRHRVENLFAIRSRFH